MHTLAVFGVFKIPRTSFPITFFTIKAKISPVLNACAKTIKLSYSSSATPSLLIHPNKDSFSLLHKSSEYGQPLAVCFFGITSG